MVNVLLKKLSDRNVLLSCFWNVDVFMEVNAYHFERHSIPWRPVHYGSGAYQCCINVSE